MRTHVLWSLCWRLAALPVAACGDDLFHGTDWSTACAGAACAGATSSVSSTSGGEGGDGGDPGEGGRGSSASSGGGAGGAGGSGGGAGGGPSCLTCAEAIEQGAPMSRRLCPGSADLYAIFFACACGDGVNPGSCSMSCMGDLCAQAPIADTCGECAATSCATGLDACLDDT